MRRFCRNRLVPAGAETPEGPPLLLNLNGGVRSLLLPQGILQLRLEGCGHGAEALGFRIGVGWRETPDGSALGEEVPHGVVHLLAGDLRGGERSREGKTG